MISRVLDSKSNHLSKIAGIYSTFNLIYSAIIATLFTYNLNYNYYECTIVLYGVAVGVLFYIIGGFVYCVVYTVLHCTVIY